MAIVGETTDTTAEAVSAPEVSPELDERTQLLVTAFTAAAERKAKLIDTRLQDQIERLRAQAAHEIAVALRSGELACDAARDDADEVFNEVDQDRNGKIEDPEADVAVGWFKTDAENDLELADVEREIEEALAEQARLEPIAQAQRARAEQIIALEEHSDLNLEVSQTSAERDLEALEQRIDNLTDRQSTLQRLLNR